MSSQITEMTVQPSTSGEHHPLTVITQRELDSQHLGGEEVLPEGPATQPFTSPHPAPVSRKLKDIKIKLGLEDNKKEEAEVNPDKKVQALVRKTEGRIREEDANSSSGLMKKRKKQEEVTKKKFKFAYLHVPGPEADHQFWEKICRWICHKSSVGF